MQEVDDLTCLPHVGPETQTELQQNSYGSFEQIALSTPFELHVECGIGLSDTAGIINGAMDNLDMPCPNCGHTDINPIWGGFPGQLSDDQRDAHDVFCADCQWLGTLPADEDDAPSQPTVEA